MDEPEFAAILERELDEYAGYVEAPDSIPLDEPSEFLLIEIGADDVRRVFCSTRTAEAGGAGCLAGGTPRGRGEQLSWNSRKRSSRAKSTGRIRTWISPIDCQPACRNQSENGLPEWLSMNSLSGNGSNFREPATWCSALIRMRMVNSPAWSSYWAACSAGAWTSISNSCWAGMVSGDWMIGPAGERRAIDSAEEDGAAGFRVTRVETDLQNSRVVVETVLSGAGCWRCVGDDLALPGDAGRQ